MAELPPFERWVRISAALAATPTAKRGVHLERWGHSEASWAEVERGWGTALARDIEAGRNDRIEAYGQACAAARAGNMEAISGEAAQPEASSDTTSKIATVPASPADPSASADETAFGAAPPNEPTLPFVPGSFDAAQIAALRAEAAGSAGPPTAAASADETNFAPPGPVIGPGPLPFNAAKKERP